MTIKPEILAAHEEATAWRQDLHRHPELGYEVGRTAGIVAGKLRAFGCDEVTEGIGQTGVVGVVCGKGGGGETIGFRADMDALPIVEANDFAHKSHINGRMHACGHDGHTAMLLAAAKHLAATRNFCGRVAFIFQPAEEGGAGGLAMVKDGLMERFDISRVFGMHNMPGVPAGEFAICEGVIMASSDFFDIDIEGKGGHAAQPHLCADVVLAGAQIVSSLQALVAREVNPLDAAVVSICAFHAGDAHNVLPQTARLQGTARALHEDLRVYLERRLGEISAKLAEAHGVLARLNYRRLYPPTVNNAEQTQRALHAARRLAGEAKVCANVKPMMGGEDFSFMLNARPGAFIFIGNGKSAGLHHPQYDFNDEIIPLGASYWATLAEAELPAA